MQSIRIMATVVIVATVLAALATAADSQNMRSCYTSKWEWLDQRQTSRWLMNTKRGLFVYGPCTTEVEEESHFTLHGHKPNGVGHILSIIPRPTWPRPYGIAACVSDGTQI